MFIKDIKIIGGIHNDNDWSVDITEEQLALLSNDLAQAIRNHTHKAAWINIDYVKSIGHKLK